MMRVWLTITVLFWGLCAASEVRAETPITYAEAMKAALEANPTLGKARFSVTEAKANLSGSWGGFDPNFELRGGWDQRNQRGFFQG